MSIKLMAEIWDDDEDGADLKGSALLVMLALADFASDEGLCWPHVETLARRARISKRQVHRVLLDLGENGYVIVPPGERSENNPFVVGRQNVTRHPRHSGGDIHDTPDVTSTSRPYVEPSGNRQGTTNTPVSPRPTASQLERAAIDEIWAHYLEAIPSRRVLDAKRTRVIRNAIHTVRAAQQCDLDAAVELVKQAVTGLSLSPWHNGQNPDHRSYLELHYALRGKGDESDDTRIEKAISWAAIYSPSATVVDEAKAQRWLDDVRYHLGKLAADPNSTSGRDRAMEAYHRLKVAGLKVVRLDRPPYARLSR